MGGSRGSKSRGKIVTRSVNLSPQLVTPRTIAAEVNFNHPSPKVSRQTQHICYGRDTAAAEADFFSRLGREDLTIFSIGYTPCLDHPVSKEVTMIQSRVRFPRLPILFLVLALVLPGAALAQKSAQAAVKQENLSKPVPPPAPKPQEQFIVYWSTERAGTLSYFCVTTLNQAT